MRNFLGTPVPRVYAWSSKANENPVGAEYIIMEKLPGIQLDDVWRNMGFQERWDLTQNIARYQSAWASIRFKQLGSLYYAQDLDQKSFDGPLAIDQHGDEITDKKFAVGPSNGREFVDNEKANISFDRGPCKTFSAVMFSLLMCNV